MAGKSDVQTGTQVSLPTPSDQIEMTRRGRADFGFVEAFFLVAILSPRIEPPLGPHTWFISPR